MSKRTGLLSFGKAGPFVSLTLSWSGDMNSPEPKSEAIHGLDLVWVARKILPDTASWSKASSLCHFQA